MLFPGFDVVLFGIYYVMTEGAVQDIGPWEERKIVALLFIDVLQVVRVITGTGYSWSAATSNAVRYCDIVYIFTKLVSSVIPRFSFFILAFILVSVTLIDTVYVAKLFGDNEVKKMWPVKLLRAVVVLVVTILFSSVIKWLLIPIDCLVSSEPSLSAAIHGPGAPCTPFIFPDILATMPTLVLIACYITFSIVSSRLVFATSPLADHPRAQSTGRVEVRFATLKVAITLLVYFARYVTPVTCTFILFVGATFVVRKHIKVLPYHHVRINMCRGGILLTVWWLACCSFILSVMRMATGITNPQQSPNQIIEWVFISAIIPMYILGNLWVVRRRAAIHKNLNRLRNEWQKSFENKSETIEVKPFEGLPKGRSAFDRFYRSAPTGSTAFACAADALTSARELFQMHKEEDHAFLAYIIQRGMEEFPSFHEIQMFQLSALRFIFREKTQADALSKVFHVQTSLALDHRYVLYSMDRKAGQESEGANLGGGQVNAISVMEFNSGMERAKKFHLACLSKMKNFWHLALRRSTDRAHVRRSTVDAMLKCIDDFDHARHKAKQDYASLLDKYPSSVALLRNYATFCDTILNDVLKAEKLRRHAMMIEDENDSEDDDFQAALEHGAQQSAGTSDQNENTRLVSSRLVASHRHMIMGMESAKIKKLHWRVRQGVLILLVLATATFCITDFYLFKATAMKNLRLIDSTGLFSVYSVSALFYFREQMIASYYGDSNMVDELSAKVKDYSTRLRDQHYSNYQDIPPALSEFYHNTPLTQMEPVSSRWKVFNHSYWYTGNDYVSRMASASSVDASELQDPNFELGSISPQKRNMAYMFENTFRNMLPAFAAVLALYEDQVNSFGFFVRTLVVCNCVLNSILISSLAFIILRSFRKFIHKLNHPYKCCCFALYIPRDMSKILYKFYQAQETEMMLIDDEEAQQQELMNENTGENEQDHTQEIGNINGMGDELYQEDVGVPESPTAKMEGNYGEQALEHVGDSRHSGGGNNPSVSVVSEPKQPLTYEECDNAMVDSFNKSPDDFWNSALMQSSGGQSPMTPVEATVPEAAPALDLPSLVQISGAAAGGRMHARILRQTMMLEAQCKTLLDAPPAPEAKDGAGEEKAADATKEEAQGKAEVSGADGGEVTKEAAISVGDVEISTNNIGAVHEAGELVEQSGVDHAVSGGDRDKHAGDVESYGASGKPPQGLDDVVREEATKDVQGSLETGEEETSEESRKEVDIGNPLRRDSTNSHAEDLKKINDRRAARAAKNALPTEVTEATDKEFRSALKSRRNFFIRTPVYVVCFIFTFALCFVSILYPARWESSIVNLAPTIRQSDQRHYLILTCIHLARELVLNDGLSRLSKQQIASALKWHLDRARQSDSAIRLGGDLGITVGADKHSPNHNTIMYESGCPWRDDGICENGLLNRPSLAGKGLFPIFVEFFATVDTVLERYAPQPFNYDETFIAPSASSPDLNSQSYGFNTVSMNVSKYEEVLKDRDLSFLLECFEGDLRGGMELVQSIFLQQKDTILEQLHYENRLLFGVYVVQIAIIFYLYFFRTSMQLAMDQTTRVKKFVDMLPAYLLPKGETEMIIHYFAPAAAEMDIKNSAQENEDGSHKNPDDSGKGGGHETEQAKNEEQSRDNLTAAKGSSGLNKFPGKHLLGIGQGQEQEIVPPSPVPITPTPWAIKMAPPKPPP